MIKETHPLPARLPPSAHEKLHGVYRQIRAIALKYCTEAAPKDRAYVLTDKVQHRVVYGVDGPTDSVEAIEAIVLDWMARHATAHEKECSYRLVVAYMPEGQEENRKKYQSIHLIIHRASWWVDSLSDDARTEQPRIASQEDVSLTAPPAQQQDPLTAIINANNAATLSAQRLNREMMDAYMRREEAFGKTVVNMAGGMLDVINGAKEMQDRALKMVEKSLAHSETREEIAAERDIALAEAEANRKKWEQALAILQSQGLPMIGKIMEARAQAATAKATAEAKAQRAAAAATVVDVAAVEVNPEPIPVDATTATQPAEPSEANDAEQVPERHALAIAQAMAGLDDDTRARVVSIVGEERWKRLSDPDASGEEIVRIMGDEIPDDKKLELLGILPQETLVLLAGAFGL